MNQTIDSRLIYELLKKKGVETFHHANTARTSHTFIREGALLSRQYVEEHELLQTEQYTDDKDKVLGVWNCVFLDGTDLHKMFAYRNKYGPILFHISLDVLLDSCFPTVMVTRKNPASWTTLDNNFYDSVNDLEKDYLTGDKFRDGGIMFIFEKPANHMSLLKHCTKIIVDDPKVSFKCSDGSVKLVSDMAIQTIRDLLQENKLSHIPVEIRHPDGRACNCYFQYSKLVPIHQEFFNKLFAK